MMIMVKKSERKWSTLNIIPRSLDFVLWLMTHHQMFSRWDWCDLTWFLEDDFGITVKAGAERQENGIKKTS